MEDEVVAELISEFSNAINGDFGGVVEIVNYNRPESAQEQLKNGVAAYVSGTASDQNVLLHNRGGRTLRETEKKKPPEMITNIKLKRKRENKGFIEKAFPSRLLFKDSDTIQTHTPGHVFC